MDYAPPPELRPHYAFMQQAMSHAEARPNELLKVFGLRELFKLRDQGHARQEECLVQLQRSGNCVLRNMRAGDDQVTFNIDRNCIVVVRSGNSPGTIAMGLPQDVSSLLPKPKTSVAPLQCPKPVEPKPETTGQSVQQVLSYASVTYRFG
jgi:hypothetical protein